MTEEEWLIERGRPQTMYWTLVRQGKVQRTKAGKRKLRLFGCGCCRHLWHLLDDEVLRPALEAAERFAEGEADKDELRRWANAVAPLTVGSYDADAPGAGASTAAAMVEHACGPSAQESAFYPTAFQPTLLGHRIAGRDGDEVLCHLFRDVFGNPFRPSAVKREWLAWNDRTLPAMARAIYDERAWERLPILADALEDAGCAEEAILAHCRGPGPHTRGCWVVDLLHPAFLKTHP